MNVTLGDVSPCNRARAFRHESRLLLAEKSAQIPTGDLQKRPDILEALAKSPPIIRREHSPEAEGQHDDAVPADDLGVFARLRKALDAANFTGLVLGCIEPKFCK